MDLDDLDDIDINYLYGQYKISNMIITKLRYIKIKNSKYMYALESHIILTKSIINYLFKFGIYIDFPNYINTKYYPQLK